MSKKEKKPGDQGYHSIKYSRIDLQINSLLQFIPFHLLPLTAVIYALWQVTIYFDPKIWWSWAVYLGLALPIGYGGLLIQVILAGIGYRLIPELEAGKRYRTYSKEWLRWGMKAEMYKIIADFDLIYNYILKVYSLRWLYFKLIGLKIAPSSMIATDVRIYEPHFLEVGKDVLLPVYSLFSGHLITGSTMIMGRIKIGDYCRLGAQSGYSPGVSVGDRTTIGFGVLLGPFASVGEGCIVDSGTKIADMVKIGNNVMIGKDCVIDRRVEIADGVKIPNFTRIRAKRKITCDEDIFKPGFGDRRINRKER